MNRKVALAIVMTLIAVAAIGQNATNQPPTASFEMTPMQPKPGEVVKFDASESSDPDDAIASYHWQFGDGSAVTGQTAQHTYGRAGQTTVVLTVTDAAGNADTERRVFEVKHPPLFPLDFARQALRPLMDEFQTALDNIDSRLSTLVTVTEAQTAAIEAQTQQLERIADALQAMSGTGDEPVRIHIESFGGQQ